MFSWLRTTTSSWLLILILGSRSRDITRLGSVYMVRLIFSGTSIIDWEGNLLIGVIRYDWSPVTYWYLWQDNTLTSYTSIVKTPSSFPKHGDVHFAGNMEHKFAGYLHYLVLSEYTYIIISSKRVFFLSKVICYVYQVMIFSSMNCGWSLSLLFRDPSLSLSLSFIILFILSHYSKKIQMKCPHF